MKDIAIYKSIYLNEKNGIHLQQFVTGEESSELYNLDLMNFDVFEFSKFCDGDLLTLQFCTEVLDSLCNAWVGTQKQ